MPHEDWYGDAHKAERAKYEEVIRLHGGQCMEKLCVLESRRIEPGAKWHLAHDHERGGQHDYLGPAHPECNEREAKSRRGEWLAPIDDQDVDTWADGFIGVPLPVGTYTAMIRRWDPHFMTDWDGTFNWAYTYEVTEGKFAGRKQVERIIVGRYPLAADGQPARSLAETVNFSLATSAETEDDLKARFAAIGDAVRGVLAGDPLRLVGAVVRFAVAPRPHEDRVDEGWPYDDVQVTDVRVLKPPPSIDDGGGPEMDELGDNQPRTSPHREDSGTLREIEEGVPDGLRGSLPARLPSVTINATATRGTDGLAAFTVSAEGLKLSVWSPDDPNALDDVPMDPHYSSVSLSDDAAAAFLTFVRNVRPSLFASIDAAIDVEAVLPDITGRTTVEVIEWSELPEPDFDDPAHATVTLSRSDTGEISMGVFSATDGELCTVTVILDRSPSFVVAGDWCDYTTEGPVQLSDSDLIALLTAVKTVRPDLWARSALGATCPAPWKVTTTPRCGPSV